MSFIEIPRFPDTLAYGATGGPGWSTEVVGTHAGNEQRNQRWARARAEYEIGLVNRSFQETQDLFAFFYAVANGRLNGFRFKDFLPGEAEGVDEPIANGDGVEDTFQLVKWYFSGDNATYARVISKPVADTTTIYLDAVATTAFTMDTATGMFTMASPPGANVIITASFQFDVPVRFNVDVIRCQRLDANAYSWPSIPLIETRDIT